jgi:cytochrome P450
VQERVHEEVDRELGCNEGPIDKQQFFRMTYLDMVLKETLRLYSPPFVVRQLHHDLPTGQ